MIPRRHVKILVSLRPNHHPHQELATAKKKKARATLRRIERILDLCDATACILSDPDLASGTGIDSGNRTADSPQVAQGVVRALIEQVREQVEEMGQNGEISAERSAWYQNQVGDLKHRLWATEMLVSLH